MGCPFLLQGMKVKCESEVAQSCPTLCVCARMRALCGWVAGTLVQLPLSGFVFYRTRARLTQQLVLRASMS